MTERLLQYIWQFQYFNVADLKTEEGENVQVINAGTLNKNQGPDFSGSKIRIGDTTWAGSIELHVKSSDWRNHKHSGDKNYLNVILHVVWQHDINLKLPFATLVLQDKVPKVLLNRYYELMNTQAFIPCENSISRVNSITWQSWKERLLIERLENKTSMVLSYLEKNNGHWEETLWWLLARNFGIRQNSDAFEQLAQHISLTILAKHKNQIHQVEALLFGQAGMLESSFEEAYPKMLQREYLFLQKKYKLNKPVISFNFLRMRPANFPSIRLAQLAMLIHKSLHLFAAIKEADQVKKIADLLQVTANDYWHYHYRFDEVSAFKKKKMGSQTIENILINTVVPVLFAYGHYHALEIYKDKALQWLEQLKPEKNSITSGFGSIGVVNKTAFDSQALIQLKNEYCEKKRCLECSVGNKILGEGR